ncbi:putative leucine-rich repeat-containing protein DDB_G0290503 isoform X1 [Neodiprion virginianus]|uniref:putative leucine-rich repeat-containing protein DDB_G0290503 isoform X1 n=1 Tax=Neodiprion virginianus TaxID=2961670 RepID=UPI001EE742CB|nr:putative leucine-rich repeat-containing protein DDB_G0290503 isoform X1 [Neodiprion virginianus]
MDNSLIVTNLHSAYFAVLSTIQEQLQNRRKEYETISTKMKNLVKSKNCLEEKYKNLKKLWQEASEELQELKSILTKRENEIKGYQTDISNCKADMKEKNCAMKDLTSKLASKDARMKEMEEMHSRKIKDLEDLLKKSENIEKQLRNKILVSTEKDKDMRKQLQKYKIDLEIFEEELKSERKSNGDVEQLRSENESLKQELGDHTRETEAVVNELQILKEKEIHLQQELKENERTEELKNLNERLRKDFEILQLDKKNTEFKLKRCAETIAHLHDEVNLKNKEMKALSDQVKDFEETKTENSRYMEQLEKQLQLSEEQTEECLGELNVSKELLAVLRDRVSSLKLILQEKSDDMVKLQADHQILKNANSILKAEQGIFENKASEDINDLKKRLKGVQTQLSLMENNYRKVTQDFNKSQELLVEATKREVDLQRTLTSMENNLLSKLSLAEQEENRLSDIVDKLSEELEDAHNELLTKSSQLCQAQCHSKCYANQLESVQKECQKHKDDSNALRITVNKLEAKLNELMCCNDTENTHLRTQIDNHTSCIRSLQEKLLKMEEVKCCLSKQLQQSLEENCDLSTKKSVLEQKNFKCVSELQDMHRSLLELRQEYQVKAKSLVSMSAELSQVAVSRSELCTESQHVVSCIRAWMDEQKNLVETLASKLNVKQQQVMQLAFEKKALLATVRELRRANCALTQRIKRLHKPSVCSRGTKSVYNGYRSSQTFVSNFPNGRTDPSNSNHSRVGKKSCLGPIRNARRTSVCGNSWWFPKMEHLTQELRRNNQWWSKNAINKAESDPGLDESRDCGYQSSTSK